MFMNRKRLVYMLFDLSEVVERGARQAGHEVKWFKPIVKVRAGIAVRNGKCVRCKALVQASFFVGRAVSNTDKLTATWLPECKS